MDDVNASVINERSVKYRENPPDAAAHKFSVIIYVKKM